MELTRDALAVLNAAIKELELGHGEQWAFCARAEQIAARNGASEVGLSEMMESLSERQQSPILGQWMPRLTMKMTPAK